MKTYNINFTHPVKGTAFLYDCKKKTKHVVQAESDDNFVVKIPLEGLEKGQWTINFAWEHDDREYDCNGEFTLS